MSSPKGARHDSQLPFCEPARGARLAPLILLVLTLGACAAVPPNPMTAEQRQALSISEISVDMKPDGTIWWGEAERDFAASKGCQSATAEKRKNNKINDEGSGEAATADCDYHALIESPEAKRYLEGRVIEVLERNLTQQVQPAFVGTAPAKLSVHIGNVHIVSTGEALIVGGSHILQADFEVTDLATGQSMARYDELMAMGGYGAGGLIALAVEASSEDPYERLATEYAVEVREWLKAEKR